jgi:hypothetical protein
MTVYLEIWLHVFSSQLLTFIATLYGNSALTDPMLDPSKLVGIVIPSLLSPKRHASMVLI